MGSKLNLSSKWPMNDDCVTLHRRSLGRKWLGERYYRMYRLQNTAPSGYWQWSGRRCKRTGNWARHKAR